MSSMYNFSNFSLWIFQIIIAFNLLCIMLLCSHLFNLLNALKLAGDTISNFNKVWISGNNFITC